MVIFQTNSAKQRWDQRRSVVEVELTWFACSDKSASRHCGGVCRTPTCWRQDYATARRSWPGRAFNILHAMTPWLSAPVVLLRCPSVLVIDSLRLVALSLFPWRSVNGFNFCARSSGQACWFSDNRWRSVRQIGGFLPFKKGPFKIFSLLTELELHLNIASIVIKHCWMPSSCRARTFAYRRLLLWCCRPSYIVLMDSYRAQKTKLCIPFSIWQFPSGVPLGPWSLLRQDRIVRAWEAIWLFLYEYCKHHTLPWNPAKRR